MTSTQIRAKFDSELECVACGGDIERLPDDEILWRCANEKCEHHEGVVLGYQDPDPRFTRMSGVTTVTIADKATAKTIELKLSHELRSMAVKCGPYFNNMLGIGGISSNMTGELVTQCERFLLEAMNNYGYLCGHAQRNDFDTVDKLLEFARAYREACVEFPNARVEVVG